MTRLRNLLTRIRDTRSGDTTDPLGQADDPWLDELAPDPDEDTDPGGADLASVDPLHEPPPGAIRSVQPLYGPDVRRCGVIGCGVPTTGEVCVKCTENGKTLADLGAAPWDGRSDGYVPPGMERILPDPPLRPGYDRTPITADELSRWAWDDPREQARRRDVVEAIGDHPERVRAYVRTHPVDLPTLDPAGYVLEPLPDGDGRWLDPDTMVFDDPPEDFEEARDQLRAEVLQRIDAEADDRPWFGVCEPAPSVAYLNRLCGIDTDGAA